MPRTPTTGMPAPQKSMATAVRCSRLPKSDLPTAIADGVAHAIDVITGGVGPGAVTKSRHIVVPVPVAGGGW